MSDPHQIPNTLQVPAHAERVALVQTEDELRAILGANDRVLVLGGASNVVLGDTIDGCVCLIRNRGINPVAMGGGVEVTAAAGESWHALVRYTLGRGLFGLENLALIPGSVGAAPLQNIGAYGVELSQRLVRLRAMRVSDGAVRTFAADECGFGYRDSWFKSTATDEYVIVDVTLALSTQPQLMLDYPDLKVELGRMGISRPGPRDVAEAVIRVRRRKLPDPRHVGNVGSFFKNPVVSGSEMDRLQTQVGGLVAREVASPAGAFKLSAAQLIDQAHGKGERLGGAGVWFRQPLVLVNRGGATGADFVALAARIQEKVYARFGVRLETEPRIYGL